MLVKKTVINIYKLDHDERDEKDLEEAIADYLLDKYGYCVNNFCYKLLRMQIFLKIYIHVIN